MSIFNDKSSNSEPVLPTTPEKKSASGRFAKISSSLNFTKSPQWPAIKKGLKYTVGLVFVSVFLLALDLISSGRILPGTQLGSTSLAYLNLNNANAKLSPIIKNYLETPLTFTLENKTIKISPHDLGMTFSMAHFANTLPVYNWKKNTPLDLIAALFQNKSVPLELNFDGDRALKILEDKFQIKPLRAQNANIAVKNKNVEISPERDGQIINRTQLLGSLEANIHSLSSSPIPVELIKESATVTAAELDAQKNVFLASINKPLNLWHEQKKWKIDPLKHLDALTFQQKKSIHLKNLNWTLPIILSDEIAEHDKNYDISYSTSLAFNPDVIGEFLNSQIISSINKPTSNLKITMAPDEKVKFEGQGNDGKTVAVTRLFNSIAIALNTDAKAVQMPVYEEKALISIAPELQNLGIKELISTGYTTYFGSPPNRMFNITHGINMYNGLLVKPGETFSFNKYLGEVDGASGFLPEKVIKSNKIELEFGGGICQVSSTAYRAALFAGLPIVERAPHSWNVAYYSQVLGPGLDATIYPGSHDFKFLNDTPGYILIQAFNDGPRAYFKFFGTNDGRKTAMEGPIGSGLNYKWYRTVEKEGTAKKEAILSAYKAVPADANSNIQKPAAPTPTPAPTKPTAQTPPTPKKS